MKYMKKSIAMLLALALILSSAVFVFGADENHKAVQTVKALGIMTGDDHGNMMLDSAVTRAQLAKMLVAASSYRDTVGEEGSGYSLFKDVKSTHWASEYIRVVVQLGWMIGYTDGTFRPDKALTVEEACTAVLNALGFDSSKLAGSWPAAQMSKAGALGLRDGITLKQGQIMSRFDCAKLFYNLFKAKNYNNQTYAATLGYSMINGEVDYNSVTKNNLSGPYIARGGDALPISPLTIYRDGNISKSYVLNPNDVYYYHSGLRTLWIYTNRVSGKVNALSPSVSSPSTVNVAGTSYSIGSANAAYQLSALGGGGLGTYVTLLLGMDGSVVGVLTGEEVDEIYYGVVKEFTENAVNTADAKLQNQLKISCSDGTVKSFVLENSASYKPGSLVCVNVAGGGLSVKSLSEKHLSGKVNAAATRLGEYTLADNVRIIDSSEEGDGVAVDSSLLAGCTLSSSNVRYYTTNAEGQVDNLILNNATGEIWTYVYMTGFKETPGISQMLSTATYTFYNKGSLQSYVSSNSTYMVQLGGVGIRYEADGKTPKTMRSLAEIEIDQLSSGLAVSGNTSYQVSDTVQVYLKNENSLFLTTLGAVNADEYKLFGYYDNFGCPAGGKLRIIVAEIK